MIVDAKIPLQVSLFLSTHGEFVSATSVWWWWAPRDEQASQCQVIHMSWAGNNPYWQFGDSAASNSITHFGQCSQGKVSIIVSNFWYKCYISRRYGKDSWSLSWERPHHLPFPTALKVVENSWGEGGGRRGSNHKLNNLCYVHVQNSEPEACAPSQI